MFYHITEKRDEIDKKRCITKDKQYITRDEINQKEHKNKDKFSQEKAKDCCIQTLLQTYENGKNNFFPQSKSLERKYI